MTRQKNPRAELSIKENFALCQFLTTRQKVPGETYTSIAKEAAVALKNERINNDHIKNRHAALELQLEPSAKLIPSNGANNLNEFSQSPFASRCCCCANLAANRMPTCLNS